MKIQYCSDLHLEYIENRLYLFKNPLQVAGDILILAGDVVPMHKKFTKHEFFDYISDHYSQVYWLAGNHEYYHRDIADFNESFNIPIRKNVNLINNTTILLNDITFIYTTLWSRIHPSNAEFIEKNVVDFELITDNGNYFTTNTYNRLHKNCLKFLESSLEQRTSKTIVVTHHLPALACNSEEFLKSKINDAFCVDLTKFITTCNVDYWIYGHSHYNQQPIKIGNTSLLTNQIGYVKSREHKTFKHDAFIEI